MRRRPKASAVSKSSASTSSSKVQAGAGASFNDDDYDNAGATIVADARQLWGEADILLKVQPPEQHPVLGVHEADLLRPGATLISFSGPGKNQALVERLAAAKATAIAIDQVPRITRAQKMDALWSMANIAGYRAVIEAASFYGRFFTGQMTAAGTRAAGQGAGDRRRRRGACRDWRGPRPGGDRARVRHARRGHASR